MNLAEFVLVRGAIADILLAARDDRRVGIEQYTALLYLCLQTQGWCTREEVYLNLLATVERAQGNPITREVLDALLARAEQERQDHDTRLSAFATSLFSGQVHH